MAASFEKIERQAQALVAEERAKLAEVLLESLQTPLSPIKTAWAQEIEERVAASDRGEAQDHAVEDVFAQARRRTRRSVPGSSQYAAPRNCEQGEAREDGSSRAVGGWQSAKPTLVWR